VTELVGLKKLEIWRGRKIRTVWHPQGPSDVSDTLELELELVLDNNSNLQTLEVGGIVIRDLPIVVNARRGNLRVLKLREFAEIKEAQRSRKNIKRESFKDGLAAPPKEDPYSKFHFPTVSLNSLKLIQQSRTFITELDWELTEQNDVNAYQTTNP
jgi:hypothetical protein